ncbi:MAG: phosphoenolpyruvate--protein phosphotransferase [Endomicrobium sp.]|jgi:phosphotransferase system enzyme I (PtsI)|nr:phosphoenolpyruvate--protein phosphotransferase [Endomicrobium sp.]
MQKYKMLTKDKKNFIFKGVTASLGIAIGKVFAMESKINFDSVFNKVILEKQKLTYAINKTKLELNTNYEKIKLIAGKRYAQIIKTYSLILKDHVIKKNIDMLIDSGIDARSAIINIINKLDTIFITNKNSQYFKDKKSDIEEVWFNVINNLDNLKFIENNNRSFKFSKNLVIVANNLTINDIIYMREKFVIGFALDKSSKISHNMIIAQGLKIPAVVGLETISLYAKNGNNIIIDGYNGHVILNPTKSTLKMYSTKRYHQYIEINDLKKIKDLPCETLDKHKILISANISNPIEIQSSFNNNEIIEIGLYRTEYLYNRANSIPDENTHFWQYFNIINKIQHKTITIRTVNLNEDMLIDLGLIRNEYYRKKIGLTAIKLYLKYPELLENQLKGILRASAYGTIKIMFPMVTDLDDLKIIYKILNNVKLNLKKKNIKFDENIKIGVIIEVPSAVTLIDLIVKEVDFISIGTNDLIQYSLAIDREYIFYEPLHPAILRAINTIISVSHNVGLKVSLCGEMASNPSCISILLGLELDEFSVSLPQILNTKKIIRNLTFAKTKKLSKMILQCTSKTEILNIMNNSTNIKC